METPTTATVFNNSKRVTHLHWFVSVLEIITAVICSFVLMNEIQPARGNRVINTMPETAVGYKLISLKDIAAYSLSVGLHGLRK